MIRLSNTSVNKYLLLFLVLWTSEVFCQNTITIHGRIANCPENVKVVFANVEDGTPIDTTFIEQGEFEFVIEPLDSVLRGVFIDNPDLGEYANEVIVFLVEDSDIEISGSYGDLKYSRVLGGEVQSQYQSYRNSIEKYSRKYDTLNALSFEAYENQEAVLLDSLGRVLEELIMIRVKIGLEYISNHPDHYFSLLRLESSMPLISKEELTEYFQKLDYNLRSHPIGKNIESVINRNQLLLDDFAPDFRLSDSENNWYQLSDFRGKYVLIDFWASWCGSCRIENDVLASIYNQFEGQNIEFISVSLDARYDNWVKASVEDNISWVNLIADPSSSIMDDYNILLIPTSFLVDPNGVVVGINLRGQGLQDRLNLVLKND